MDGLGGFISELIDCCDCCCCGGGDCWILSGLYTGGNDCKRLY